MCLFNDRVTYRKKHMKIYKPYHGEIGLGVFDTHRAYWKDEAERKAANKIHNKHV